MDVKELRKTLRSFPDNMIVVARNNEGVDTGDVKVSVYETGGIMQPWVPSDKKRQYIMIEGED